MTIINEIFFVETNKQTNLKAKLNRNFYGFIIIDWFFVDDNVRIDIATIFCFAALGCGHTARCVEAFGISDFTKELPKFIETILFALQFIG